MTDNNSFRQRLIERLILSFYKCAVAVVFCTCTPVHFAFAQQPEVKSESLADLIRQQKLAPGQSLEAVLSENQAIVTCDRNSTDDDNGCKRRAVLIAKCVFDSQPNEIQKARIVFLNLQNNSVSTVSIKRAEVQSFAEGKLDEKTLLGSIDFAIEGGPSGPTTAADGEMQLQRTILLRRIQNMKKQGTNVNAFMSIFTEIETLAKSNDKEKLASRIDFLKDKVDEQEAMVKAAKNKSSATSLGGHDPAKIAPLPRELAAALAEANVGKEFTFYMTKLRSVLLTSQSDPKARKALQTLDQSIMSKDIFKMSAAMSSIPETIRPQK